MVVWGDANYGGDAGGAVDNLIDVVTIHSANRAFAAKKTDGTVVVWGDANYGGDATVPNGPVDWQMSKPSTPLRLAFAAKKTDGTVVVWGYASGGGDAAVPNGPVDLTNVDTIYSANQGLRSQEDRWHRGGLG